MIGSAFGVLFDGFAYGMLLFLLSVGLSVTLGMMNFVNLAHCSFAMLGGYVTVTLTNELGWPFLATLPLAFLAAAVVSVAFERTLYRRLYRATDLDQCLFVIAIFAALQNARHEKAHLLDHSQDIVLMHGTLSALYDADTLDGRRKKECL